MAVTYTGPWIYVTLVSGGLESNVAALYPDLIDSEIAGIAKQWFDDNTDILYLPYVYNVGTKIRVRDTSNKVQPDTVTPPPINTPAQG